MNSHSPAYFAGGPEQATIVLGRLAEDQRTALRHEYVHYLMRAGGRKWPVWLDEGMAEYFGGVTESRAKARMRRLRGRGWMELEELMSVGRQAALSMGTEEAERFYGESWALVGLLMERCGAACGWSDVERWASGDLGERSELKRTLRRGVEHLSGRGGGGVERVEARVRPMAEGEVRVVLAAVRMQVGDLSGARARLSEGLEGSAEGWGLLGEVELRQGRREEARKAYREAVRLGSMEKRVLWQLAVLEQDAGGEMVPVLEKLVAVDPGFDEARLALSSQYLRQHRYAEALAQLRSVRAASREQSDYYQQAMAAAEWGVQVGWHGDAGRGALE